MTNSKYYPFVLLLALAVGCKSSNSNESSFGDPAPPTDVVEYNNPPAEGFNAEASDVIAITLADQVMSKMGGRAKWDSTNVIAWNFFGFRQLLWDKANQRVRVETPSANSVVALDLKTVTGKAWINSKEVTNPDTLAGLLEGARRAWINDSYWLVMPFKLKDSGVTLTYVREDTTMTGERSDVLRLTFENVGVTPNNAYEVWVSIDERLIKQWAYFKESDQDKPNFVLPWIDYQSFDGLLLSGERGERDLTDIKVLKQVPAGAFDSPEPLTY